MKRKITGMLLAAVMLLACVPQVAKASDSEEDYIKSAEMVTIPYSADYNPELQFIDQQYGGSVYAKKVNLEKGQMIYVQCMGVDSPIDTFVEVYREDNGNLIYERDYDRDNCYEWGETFVINPKESGTYYLVFNVYDSYIGDSDCHVDIITLDNIKNMNDIFDNAEDYTQEIDTECGADEGEYYYDDELQCVVYAKAYRINANEAQGVVAACYDASTEGDTVIKIYGTNSDGTYSCLKSVDNSEFVGLGEFYVNTFYETGTYYVVMGQKAYGDQGHLKFELKFLSDYAFGMDFTDEDNLPAHSDDDLWSWDNENHILTLKDGFEYYCASEYDAIDLPENSTVQVEENAYIASSAGCGIYGDGDITIKGTSDNSLLAIDAYSDCLNINGHVNINNCGLKLRTCDDGIGRSKGVAIADSDVYMTVCDDGIIVRKNSSISSGIDFTNSNITIISDSEAIRIKGEENVISTVTNCDVLLKSFSKKGIEILDETGHSDEDDILNVTDSKLIILSDDEPIECGTVILDNVLFDLHNTDGGDRAVEVDNEDFKFPGTFRLYDKKGKVIYEGQWDESLLNEYNNLHVGGVKVTRATSVHEHTLSDWKYDENSHWKVCTEKYCFSDDFAKSDTIANHGFTTLENGDKVCECGYTIKAKAEPGNSNTDDDNTGNGKTEGGNKDVSAGYSGMNVIWGAALMGAALLAIGICKKKSIEE